MSPIRPLEREDLPAVANLLELVYRSGARPAPPGLAGYLERIYLDNPWADPEIPSLVYVDEGDAVVGFLGSHVRRFCLDGRPIRMGVSGQLAVEPGVRRRAAGAFLMQRYLAGPQDVSMTDSASETVRRMWEGLGGDSLHLGRIGWVRLFRPFRFTTEFAWRQRRASGRADPLVDTLATAADRLAITVARRQLGTAPPDAIAEDLTPELMLASLPEITEGARFRPDYDAPFLEWLFGELAAIESRGRPVASLVRDRGRRILGWYVYYLKPGGISQVLQVVGDERDLPVVVDHLFHHARVNGAAALQGRVEPALVEPLSHRRCLLHTAGYRVLIHSQDQGYVQALSTGRALMSRLDGDWWISLSRGPFAG